MVDGNLSMFPPAAKPLLADPADPAEGLLNVWKLKGLENLEVKGTPADAWPMPLDQPRPAVPHPGPEKPKPKPREGGAVEVAVAVGGGEGGSLGVRPGGRSRVAAVGGDRGLLLLLLLEEGCVLLGPAEPC